MGTVLEFFRRGFVGGNMPTAQAATALKLAESPSYRPRKSPIGRSGDVIRAGFLEDRDANSSVRGEKWYGAPGKLGIAAEMLRDPHVSGIRTFVDRLTPLLSRCVPLFGGLRHHRTQRSTER